MEMPFDTIYHLLLLGICLGNKFLKELFGLMEVQSRRQVYGIEGHLYKQAYSQTLLLIETTKSVMKIVNMHMLWQKKTQCTEQNILDKFIQTKIESFSDATLQKTHSDISTFPIYPLLSPVYWDDHHFVHRRYTTSDWLNMTSYSPLLHSEGRTGTEMTGLLGS